MKNGESVGTSGIIVRSIEIVRLNDFERMNDRIRISIRWCNADDMAKRSCITFKKTAAIVRLEEGEESPVADLLAALLKSINRQKIGGDDELTLGEFQPIVCLHDPDTAS